MKSAARIIGVLCLILAAIALCVRCGVLYLSSNYNVASEANGLYGTLELSEGKPLYPTLQQKPYGIYLYGPLHAYLNAALIRFLGVGQLRDRVLLVRTISLISFLAAVFLLWKTFFLPRKIPHWVFALSLVLISSKFCDYATSARNDTFSLFLDVVTLVFFTHWIRYQKKSSLIFFFAGACLSIWTRQTGVMIFVSAISFLAVKRKVRLAGFLAIGYFVVNLAFFSSLYWATSGAVIDHMLLSNIRGFRPINREFFDLSILSFFASYLFFLPLLFVGIRNEKGDESFFLKLVIAWSTFLAGSCFLRAGGDVNYFFLPLFVGSFYVALGIWKLSLAQVKGRSLIELGLTAQLILIAFIFVEKSLSAYRSSQLPFAEMAQRLETEFGPMGYVMGYYAQPLGINLRGWGYYGPDVTNGGLIAKNADSKFRVLFRDLMKSLENGDISAIVIAEYNCSNANRIPDRWYKWFKPAEVWSPWLCVFRAKNPKAGPRLSNNRRRVEWLEPDGNG